MTLYGFLPKTVKTALLVDTEILIMLKSCCASGFTLPLWFVLCFFSLSNH